MVHIIRRCDFLVFDSGVRRLADFKETGESIVLENCEMKTDK